jgi:hypothetical protein
MLLIIVHIAKVIYYFGTIAKRSVKNVLNLHFNF